MSALEYIRRTCGKVISACPYTALGRKCFRSRATSGETVRTTRPDNIESAVRVRIALGRNIALIGVFCPFFWVSVLSGAELRVIAFNAVHSGIVILIGLGIMFKGKYDVARGRERS